MAPSTGKNKSKNIQARSKLDTVLLLSLIVILFSYLLCSSGLLILARLGYPRGLNIRSSLA